MRGQLFSIERNRFVEDLLSYMTLEEKLGQLNLFHPGDDPGLEAAVAGGRIGGVMRAPAAPRLQMLAIERARLGIPLLFSDDAVPLPISPWALAASWDQELMRDIGATTARAALAQGQNCLLAPQVTLEDGMTAEDGAHLAASEPLLAAQLAVAFAEGASGGESGFGDLALAIASSHGAPGRSSLRWALRMITADAPPAIDCPALEAGMASRAAFGGLLAAECRRLWTMVTDRFGTTSARSVLEAAERAVAEGVVGEAEIDAAVRGVLTAKHRLGLFRDPDHARSARPIAAENAVGADAVRRTMVLLRNEAGFLPLSPISDRVLVVGTVEGAGGACGDALSRAAIGHSMAPGLALRRPGESWEEPVPGDHFALSLTRDAAQRADFVLVVLDERHFAPAPNARWRQPTPAVLAMLRALSAAGSRVGALVATAEPVDLAGADQHFAAVLQCWRPCPGFEEALGDLLSGRESPQGRMPVAAGRFAVGDGLGFGESVFSSYALALADDHVAATVRIRNAGNFATRETVQVYVRNPDSSLRLVGFDHVTIAPGEDVPVRIDMDVAALGEVNADGRLEVSPGRHEILLGKSAARLFSGTVELDRQAARAISFGMTPALRVVRG